MDSRISWALGFTCCQVRVSRWIGAVPSADMMEVSVEKLLRVRHFYNLSAVGKRYNTEEILTLATEMKCLIMIALRFTSIWLRII